MVVLSKSRTRQRPVGTGRANADGAANLFTDGDLLTPPDVLTIVASLTGGHMRYLFAALLLVACEGPNPDYDPTAAALYWSQGDSGAPDMATSPDLSSPTCGRNGEPCCLDASARRFCTVGECGGDRCAIPDLAPPPDLLPVPPDLAWRPDLTGGACVPKCERCRLRDDCCDGTTCIDDFNNADPSRFPGLCRRRVEDCR